MEDCLYCNNKEKLDRIMLYVTDLGVSKLYLFKEQTYFGRCVVAYREHAVELIDLDDEQAALLWKDVRRVGRALQNLLHPDKINYGMYSDTLKHLHVHVVPKYKGAHSFGTTFEMNVNPPKYLAQAEYEDLIERIKQNL